jgi:hypothetical protein
MNQTITSITLPASIVQQVLSAHLNAQFLRIPHTVTGVELLDDQFVVTLEPAPEPAPVVTTTAPTVWTYPETATPTLPPNGNGHHANLEHATSEPVQPTPEVAPAEQPKSRGRRLSLVERERVRDLLGEKTLAPQQIANQLGCHVSTVYTIKKRIEADAPAVTADGAA